MVGAIADTAAAIMAVVITAGVVIMAAGAATTVVVDSPVVAVLKVVAVDLLAADLKAAEASMAVVDFTAAGTADFTAEAGSTAVVEEDFTVGGELPTAEAAGMAVDTAKLCFNLA
jgi:hypothetical protein